MIGEERVRAAERAQLRARGLNQMPRLETENSSFSYVASNIHGNRKVSSEAWAEAVVVDVANGTRKAGGNHVCRADVCHKGRLGKRGFCRMYYWHWCRQVDKKKGMTAKMTHGLELANRWSGTGPPPLQKAPPFRGAPALEVTHPFHIKMTPAMTLGPKCNHDLGVLLRLPVSLVESACSQGQPPVAHKQDAEMPEPAQLSGTLGDLVPCNEFVKDHIAEEPGPGASLDVDATDKIHSDDLRQASSKASSALLAQSSSGHSVAEVASNDAQDLGTWDRNFADNTSRPFPESEVTAATPPFPTGNPPGENSGGALGHSACDLAGSVAENGPIYSKGVAEHASDSASASSAMLEAMGAHEYYCASYAGKEQPHVEGLLATLTDALRSKERDLASARAAGEDCDGYRVARNILHRLTSGMNRRMHKGFPEMLTYLMRKPMEYCSHEFVHVMMSGCTAVCFREFNQLLGSETARPARESK